MNELVSACVNIFLNVSMFLFLSLFLTLLSFSSDKLSTTTHVLNRLSFSEKCSTEHDVYRNTSITEYLLILFIVIATKWWFLLAFTHTHTDTHKEGKRGWKEKTELIASKLAEMCLKIFYAIKWGTFDEKDQHFTSISSYFILVSIENRKLKAWR